VPLFHCAHGALVGLSTRDDVAAEEMSGTEFEDYVAAESRTVDAAFP
jgi:hypothetical protein